MFNLFNEKNFEPKGGRKRKKRKKKKEKEKEREKEGREKRKTEEIRINKKIY